MKKLIFVAFVALIGCGQDEKIEPINGRWHLQSQIPNFNLYFTASESNGEYSFSELDFNSYTSDNSSMVLSNGVIVVNMPLDSEGSIFPDRYYLITANFKYASDGMVFNNIILETYDLDTQVSRSNGYTKVKATRLD